MSAAPSNDAATAIPATEWAAVPAYSAHPAGVLDSKRRRFSSVQPVWQYVFLQVCSFGLYDLIWFYANWKLIKERNHWNITPAARAIFQVFWLRSYCHELFTLARPYGFKTNWTPEALATAYIILGAMGRAADRSPELFAAVLGIVFFAGQIFSMVPVVQALNTFWSHEQPDLPVRKTLSGGALATAVIGGLLWLVVIAGLFASEI